MQSTCSIRESEILAEALLQTVVIIPARNEESSIAHVLNDLPATAAVIVVDNGSTDSTAKIARQLNCVVVDEPQAGYGRACLAGMRRLQEMRVSEVVDCRYVAFLDGDYSDHPEELGRLLATMLRDNLDFVLGSRLSGDLEPGAMPIQSQLGNRLACSLMRWIWGCRFTDLGPFRVIKYGPLMQLEMQDQNFGWTIEMQIRATANQLRTAEVPVRYRRRIGVSKISGTLTGTVKAGYKILFTIAKFAFLDANSGLAASKRIQQGPATHPETAMNVNRSS